MRRQKEKWETLEIELEEAGDVSWWTSLLAPVAPGSRNAFLRFVGRVWGPDGREGAVIRGETFPRFLDDELPDDDAWSPGWEHSLAHLRRRIEEEGWLRAGCGLEPWAHRYVRLVAPAIERSRRRPSHRSRVPAAARMRQVPAGRGEPLSS